MRLYDDIAHLYEADVAHYTDDIAFYQAMTERAGDPLLDVMCGTGRVLVPLAAAGHTITGLDSSPAMLKIAQQRLAAAQLVERATLLQADIRTAALPTEHYTFAFVAVNSFMHLERIKDQLAALQTIRRSLVRDGVVLIDLFNPDPVHLAQEDNRLVLEREFELDGQRVFKQVASTSDLATQTSTMTYLFDLVGERGQITRRTAQITLRWFYRYELEHLLGRAGFMVLSIYGSYDLDPYRSESERLIVLATPRREESSLDIDGE